MSDPTNAARRPTLTSDHDVVIVGAHVGGAVTASLLGDAGYSVLLVDRASFPSATLGSSLTKCQMNFSTVPPKPSRVFIPPASFA
jgi:flavin-dependent dehydrogenase